MCFAKHFNCGDFSWLVCGN